MAETKGELRLTNKSDLRRKLIMFVLKGVQAKMYPDKSDYVKINFDFLMIF